MSLRSPIEYENAELRHAGMDSRHPSGLQDASGNIHVNLDSSTPCWNDVIDGLLRLTEVPPAGIHQGVKIWIGHESVKFV